MNDGILNGAAKAVPDAVKGWGVYSLIAFFMVGVYLFVDTQGRQDVEAAKRRDVRESRLVDILEKQHIALVQISATRMTDIANDITKIRENQRALIPHVVGLIDELKTKKQHER